MSRKNTTTKKVAGVGVNDLPIDESRKIYQTWSSMLRRCYDSKLHNKINYRTYIGCTVCEEWLLFSNFKRWYDENYIEGFQIDKDILVEGNKVYSPDTCRFVPHQINSLLTNRIQSSRILKQGAYYMKQSNRYYSNISIGGKTVQLGFFLDEDSAHLAYMSHKKKYMKYLSTYYYNIGCIDIKTHNAICNRIL